MKVKRLKDVIYTYNTKFEEYPFNLEVETNDAPQKGIIDLTKREALSFIKWALSEGEWTCHQLRDLHELIDYLYTLRFEKEGL